MDDYVATNPLVHRFFLAIFCIFFCLICSFFGWNYLYDKRHFLGVSLILGGCLLAGGGILLCWLTIFPVTWGWIF
jgi:hypothetical protein